MSKIERSQNGIRKSFAFYWSFKDAIRDMSDSDKLSVYEAITDFAFLDKEPCEMTSIGRLAWKLIKPQLLSSIRRYDACVSNGAIGKEFGKRGGRPCSKTPDNNPKEKPQTETPTHNPLNHNDNYNHNHNGNKKGVIEGSDDKRRNATKRRAFVAPTLAELQTYISEKGFTNVNAEQFIDHYTANGWNVGKNPMKDWQAAVRNWNRRDLKSNAKSPKIISETKPTYKAL